MVNTFHYPRGGASIYALSLANLLEKSNHEVLHFAMNHPSSIPSPLTEKYWPPYIEFPKILKEGVLRGGYKVFRRTISSKEAETGMDELLDNFDINLVHVHNILHHITPSIFKPIVKRGLPIVWTLHDYSLICPNTNTFDQRKNVMCSACLKGGLSLFNAPLRRCKKGSFSASTMAAIENAVHRFKKVKDIPDRFISPSRFLAEKFIECGFDEDKFEVVPNFIERKAPFYEKKENRSREFALYAGRLSAEKGLKTLIEAWRGMPIECSLKIAGTGPLESELKLLAKDIDNIEFLGFVHPDKLAEIRNRTAFLVVPSEWWENAPLTILEAFADGIPVLGANIGGIPEMVRSNVTGLLFESRNSEDLLNKARELFDNTEKSKKYGENARRISENEYSSESHLHRILKIYMDLLN
ncbi:glycosyltransferase [bacterium]|nr:glycosyltransferase [bacterium]